MRATRVRLRVRLREKIPASNCTMQEQNYRGNRGPQGCEGALSGGQEINNFVHIVIEAWNFIYLFIYRDAVKYALSNKIGI